MHPFPMSRWMVPATRVVAAALALVALLPGTPADAYVGRWKSWSDLNPVTALTTHQGRLYAGTSGGIRSVDPATLGEKTYDNLSGLSDVRIVGLQVDPEGRLWAASRSGLLFRLEREDTWSTWGRSYKASGWTVNARAFLAVGDYLVLGSEKGLTFFDRRQGVAAASLTRFGRDGAQPVTGLLRTGDTLYIATGTAVYRAAVDWSNALSSRFGSIYDPRNWQAVTHALSPLALPSLGKRAAEAPAIRRAAADSGGIDTVAKVDSAQGRPVHLAFMDGKLVAHDTGTLLDAPFRVKALKSRKLMVNGKTFDDSLYMAAAQAGGRLFLGGGQGLAVFADGAPRRLPAPGSYPDLPVNSITAYSGNVYVHTANMIWKLSGGNWAPYFNFGFISPEQIKNELRNIRVTPSGDLFSGTWGLGVVRLGASGIRAWNASTDGDCLKPTDTTIYTVIQSLDIRGDEMWIASLTAPISNPPPPHHWYSRLDLRTGRVTCPEIQGPGFRVTSLRILDSEYFGIAGQAGVHLYRGGTRDGRAEAEPLASIKKNFGEALGRDLALDSRGRLWVLFSEQLGYVDSLPDKLKKGGEMEATFPDNLTVKTCRDMERDPRGELWVGCDNGLFHVRPGDDPAAPWVDHYTSDNGLLSNRVLDVSIDPTSGTVWAATEAGISRFEGPSPPTRAGLSDVRAYPNPFLGKHRLLLLDNLPQGAEAAILTQSGSVVRSFRPAEMRGNQYQWDGTNASGARVKPGVYFWRVSSGSEASRGKIIVAR